MKKAIQVVLIVAILASSAPAATYDLSWWTVDGGGAVGLSGGVYSLGGTAGQPETITMSGGSYALTGGFWAATLPTTKNAAQNWLLYD